MDRFVDWLNNSGHALELCDGCATELHQWLIAIESMWGKEMSFDLAFWYEKEPRGNEAAARIYDRLTDGLTGVTEASPSLAAFVGEVVRLFPDLTEENADDSVWSSPIHHNAEAVIVTISWSRAREVSEVLFKLALENGLNAYDPQNQTSHHPGKPRSRA